MPMGVCVGDGEWHPFDRVNTIVRKYLDGLFSDTTASSGDDDDFPSQVWDVVNRKL